MKRYMLQTQIGNWRGKRVDRIILLNLVHFIKQIFFFFFFFLSKQQYLLEHIRKL